MGDWREKIGESTLIVDRKNIEVQEEQKEENMVENWILKDKCVFFLKKWRTESKTGPVQGGYQWEGRR
jgi:hypothetical protein